MPQAEVQLPDGKKARIEFTDQAQLDATITDLVKSHAAPTPHGKNALESVTNAVGEPALQAVTGLGASAWGGVKGIARGAGEAAGALASGQGAGKAADAFTDAASEEISRAQADLTYQPRTVEGRAVSGAVQSPFRLIAQGAEWAGGKAAQGTQKGLEKLGVSEPAAARAGAAVGATVDTAGQVLAPGAALKTIGRLARPAAAAEEAGRGTDPPPPRGTEGSTLPPSEGPLEPENLTRAKAYAARNGLDWTRLGAGTRKALESVAKDATALEKLDPEALKRQAMLGGFRVPIRTTRGNLTRDPVELRREAIASRTEAGAPIRDLDVGANRDLQANLEVLRGRLARQKGGLHEANEEEEAALGPSIRRPTAPRADVGAKVQQEALGAKAEQSKKGYQALYKQARETEPMAQAQVAPLHELLDKNPDIQHLGWVKGWLNKAAQVRGAKVAEGESPRLESATLNELHDLRTEATAVARAGGIDGHYAGQVIKAIDAVMDEVPEGARAWKSAISAFRKHQEEFKDQPIIRDLIGRKKGTSSNTVPLEKTVDKIHASSLDDIKRLKTSLLTGGTKATRTAGKQAWAAVRAETVNRILEDARNVVATDESEREVLTAAALRKSVNRIGRERLEEIVGKRTTDELYQYVRAARITRTQPAARVTESGTVPNALVMAEKLLSHIPGGNLVRGGAHWLKSLKERGAAAGQARRAMETPLEQAAREAEARTSTPRQRQEAATLRNMRKYQSLEGGE